MSLILLIDSVHSELAVALVRDDSARFLTFSTQKQHDKNLNPLISKLLKQEKVSFSEIDAYAVVVGPGSWTGCRVGVSAVKGFCAGHPKPVVPLNSLDALGDPSALKCNLDNYYIKRGNKYTCEKLESTEGYATLSDIEAYRAQLIEQIKTTVSITAKELAPLYITDFQIKS